MILITGGMGFIGLHTARAFLDAGEDVVLTWYQTWRAPDFIAPELGKRVFAERVDITSPHDVISVALKYNVTGIVHLAVPGLGVLSPAEDFRVNMLGLINILEAGRVAGVKRVSLASSVAVYTGVAERPFREDMPLRMYGASPTEVWKKSLEIIGLHYGERTGMSVVALRIGLIWGPLYHSMANLPSRFAHAAIKGVPSDQVGRGGGIVPFEEDGGDFCYVKDCARGIQMVHMGENLRHTVYNVAGGKTVTSKDLADAVKRVIPDAQLAMKPGKGPTWRPNPYQDLTRAREDVGYEPQYDVFSGMADYLEWLRHHPQ